MQKIRKKHRKLIAVSEVFGTILLIGISTAIFSVIYVSLFSIQVNPETPSLNLMGYVESNNLFIDHMGGKEITTDSKLKMYLNDGSTISLDVEGNLTDKNNDNKWNIGETFKVDLSSITNFERFDSVQVAVVEPDSNSIVMMGTVGEEKYADINISIEKPEVIKFNTEFNIKIKAENHGPCDVEEVDVKIDIPDGIEIIGNSYTNFSKSTCIWNISDLGVDDIATLDLKLIITQINSGYTKLVFILDGSDVMKGYWSGLLQIIHNAIMDEDKIPHDGTVELIILQYGDFSYFSPPKYPHYVKAELKRVINDTNFGWIADKVISIEQASNGNSDHRPLAYAFEAAPRIIASKDQFPLQVYPYVIPPEDLPDFPDFPNYKIIVNLVIGGDPNIAYPETSVEEAYPKCWFNAKSYKDQMVEKLQFKEYSSGEINSEAFNCDDTLDCQQLLDLIVIPQPGHIAPSDWIPGWIYPIGYLVEFEDAINHLSENNFNTAIITANRDYSSIIDPNPLNDVFTVRINPN